MSKHKPAWLADDAVVPAELRTERVFLRPLLATDVDRDYEAVMSSRAMLRMWSQSEWPDEQFTRAENLVDLERHEREHLAREAFTFTVLDPDSERCLGCVYITPIPDDHAWCRGTERVARVSFWVRESEMEKDLDSHLFEALRVWFHSDWPLDRVAFSTCRGFLRQVWLFEGAGLLPIDDISRPDGCWLLAYDGGGRA